MKIIKVISLFIILILTGISVWFHIVTETLPFSFTKSYLIQIKDKDTGKPIPGVIVHAFWDERILSLAVESNKFEEHYIMSNENGYARIPWKFGIHLFSYFNWMGANFRHPLYRTSEGIGLYSKAAIKNSPELAAENERMKFKPIVVELQTHESYFRSARCKGTRGPDWNFKQECTGNGERASSMVSMAERYFEIVATHRISDRKKEFLYTPNEVIRVLKPLALSIYSESPELPGWIGYLDKLK